MQSEELALPEETALPTEQEQHNLDLAKEYISISYDPKRASAQAVQHLCAPQNRFLAPSTFPDVHTLEEYAEDHSKLMRQVNDLHITSFDVLFAKGDRVCLRYSAEGHHAGEPHGAIAPTGRKAQWTASALFQVTDGKLSEFIKIGISSRCGNSLAGLSKSV